MIEHTYIEVMGWTLADPLTFISDLMMAAVCLFCGHRLFYDFKSKYSRYFAFFFLFLGMSALLGGTSHLLNNYLGKTPHLIAWSIQGVSILFVELACIRFIQNKRSRKALKAVAFGLFGVFLSSLMYVQSFEVVKLNSIIGLIGFVVIIHLMKYSTTRKAVYLNIVFSIILFTGPAFIHGFGLYYNKWIDQNVISHLILLPCYLILYSAVKNVALLSKAYIQPLSQSELQK